MSVSLLEVLEHGGYDILNNIDDSKWFLSKQAEFSELVDQVETYIEDAENES